MGNDLIEVIVLGVDALQPTVAFALRVDAISQPSADLLEGRGLPVRLVPREAFKFGVIRVEGNDLLLADLTSVLDHLLNEQRQFFQERLVAAKELEGLALLQDVVVELLQTLADESGDQRYADSPSESIPSDTTPSNGFDRRSEIKCHSDHSSHRHNSVPFSKD